MQDIAGASLVQISDHLSKGDISTRELIDLLLQRIERHNADLRAYITVCPDLALKAAEAVEKIRRKASGSLPLLGVPIAHKDILMTEGVRTTAHSRSMLECVPVHDATVVNRLARAGMCLLGKTNTTEFAFGAMEVFGTSRNPWNLGYFTGGSSGGAAGGVAAGLAIAATGSDTGGSIRVPASFCGVVGLKPTFGRVSRYGATPLSWSLDTIGPITRTVTDAAVLMEAMAGYDVQDWASVDGTTLECVTRIERDIGGQLLGVPEGHFYENLDPEVEAAVKSALRVFEGLGVRLETVRLPHLSALLAAAKAIMMVEGYVAHANRMRAFGRLYGVRIRRRLYTGRFLRAADYQEAWRIRTEFAHALDAVLGRVNALVTPTVPFPAYEIAIQEAKPPESAVFTSPFNLSGHPALSLPCGFTHHGLPIGLQLVGRRFDEAGLLQVAYNYERATEWHGRRPTLSKNDLGTAEAQAPDSCAPGTPAILEEMRMQATQERLPLDDEDLGAIRAELEGIQEMLARTAVPWDNSRWMGGSSSK